MLRFALFLFSGVGAFIAGFAAYRYWKKTKEARRAETTRLRLEQVIFNYILVNMVDSTMLGMLNSLTITQINSQR